MKVDIQECKQNLKTCFRLRIRKEYYEHLNKLSFLRSKEEGEKIIGSVLILDALKDLFPDLRNV